MIAQPVAGGWSPFSPVGDCSVTCGTGVITERRTCTNPRPQNGGNTCSGMATRETPCSRPACGKIDCIGILHLILESIRSVIYIKRGHAAGAPPLESSTARRRATESFPGWFTSYRYSIGQTSIPSPIHQLVSQRIPVDQVLACYISKITLQ